MGAWSSFDQTERKIARTAEASETLTSTLLWWRQLPMHKRCMRANVDSLVRNCEGVLEREREAWMSTAVTMTAMMKEMHDKVEVDASSKASASAKVHTTHATSPTP